MWRCLDCHYFFAENLVTMHVLLAGHCLVKARSGPLFVHEPKQAPLQPIQPTLF